MRLFITIIAVALLLGCDNNPEPVDAGTIADAGFQVDAGPEAFEPGTRYAECVDGTAVFVGLTTDAQQYFGTLCDHSGEVCPDFGCGRDSTGTVVAPSACEGIGDDPELVRVLPDRVEIQCAGDGWRFDRVGLTIVDPDAVVVQFDRERRCDVQIRDQVYAEFEGRVPPGVRLAATLCGRVYTGTCPWPGRDGDGTHCNDCEEAGMTYITVLEDRVRVLCGINDSEQWLFDRAMLRAR